MVKGAGDNPVLGILSKLKESHKPEKRIDEYEMHSLAFEGCGNRIIRGIKEEDGSIVAYAIKDLIALCLDQEEEK